VMPFALIFIVQSGCGGLRTRGQAANSGYVSGQSFQPFRCAGLTGLCDRGGPEEMA
jgi:hypothetical protein